MNVKFIGCSKCRSRCRFPVRAVQAWKPGTKSGFEEPFLHGLLRDAFGQHPHVGDIRGRGYFWGLELVEDRGTKAPFPAEANLAARVKAEAQRRGLLCYPGSGTVDGRSGDHVLLAPPYTASRAELEKMTGMLAVALDAALQRQPTPPEV